MMNFKRPSPKGSAGFTLIELLVAMVVFMIAAGAMYSVFEASNRSYSVQNQVVDAQNNLRAALGLLSRELRMADYDPTEIPIDGIEDADATSIHFQADINGDGVVTLDSNEDVEYLLDGTDLKRNNQVIAQNIHAVEFYYNGSSTTPPSPLEDIETVRVSMLAITANPDSRFNGGQTFTTPSGATWTTPDGHRGRYASVTVQIRNMQNDE
jgi:type IV pilus assembly protein PilW